MERGAGWWCAGARWEASGRVGLRWVGERGSGLGAGERVGFRVLGERRCLGVWRGGRWRECGRGAVLGEGGARAQCEECAALDRVRSVAADTYADDPRPYRVYLAWFGPGLVKVGITGVAREGVRLLEQGALAYCWLGQGPLMAARRAEEVVRHGLGVPDRIPYARKRAARAGGGDCRAELERVHGAARKLPGWPETLEPLPGEVVEHGGVFGLPLPYGGLVRGLRDGAVLVGTVRGVAGPDVHLDVAGEPATVVLDTRRLAGWCLAGVGEDAVTTAGLVERVGEGGEQGELF
ncbi:DUF2797 domain-containing protein [Streptomyces sp. AM 3-1-1]|uniref:DUF2797 domain-containing protein n=1 Tax=Streptomyces sp. AM 3-1-1 TaxID=3028711 RepID=UPI0023B9532B|nr:DUF2797 domain-containing protein [Streptomyces sp. AM 3-1-1]WEH28511.1 DUF2797 domain-containing protein [Streptomyces sp. AM 3-1-1]